MTSRRSFTQRKLFETIEIHDSSDEGKRSPSSPVTKRRKTSPAVEEAAATTSTPSRSSSIKKSAIVTPSDGNIAKDDYEISLYIPKYIYKNVEYKREEDDTSELPKTTKIAFQWIQEHCDIPKDLEQNRKYGPLSGSSYEERTVRAYRLGLIERTNNSAEEQLCTACATVGHAHDECPTLV